MSIAVAVVAAAVSWAVSRFPCEPHEASLNLSWVGYFLLLALASVGHVLIWPLSVVVVSAGWLGATFFLVMIGVHSWRLRRWPFPVRRPRVIPASHPEAS